ncbi:calcium/calmodulin-dependent protein kinase II inhibitor 1 [Cyclopterus lumpus]|uniref:calcium/calmodulin-dependent protein kinase II inhibitor 1 n=1 Tax=Cyclopterus lumpus TaxID=8103 RepID=UPI001486CFDA|nr:calcium/calmodulin-dependent protein kinase II inhibitor 1 [Cyclopterus lumpus]
MYGASGIPELLPTSGPVRQPGPAGQYSPGHPQVNGDGGGGGSNPQRLGQRAPKLGMIGRTKKVDLDDEDLDDIMNNNGQCPVSMSPIS